MSLTSIYPEHVAYLQRGTEQALAAHGYEALVVCSGAPQSKNRFDDREVAAKALMSKKA